VISSARVNDPWGLEFYFVLTRAVEKEIPCWAREEVGLTDILAERNLDKCSNCSLVKGSDFELPFCLMFSPCEATRGYK